MQIFILKQKDPTAVGQKIFTHFWNNDDSNYFNQDSKVIKDRDPETQEPIYVEYENSIEAFLAINYSNYEWEEIDQTKISRPNIWKVNMTIDANTKENFNNIFIKIVDGNEIPTYYYGKNIGNISNQNYNPISYVLELELDCWATFGSDFSNIMKELKEEFLFRHKMADRFLFNSSNNIYCDYLLQPYLTNYKANNMLLKDPEETDITFDQWLYINSSRKYADYTKTDEELSQNPLPKYHLDEWLNFFYGENGWNKDPWFAVFNPKYGSSTDLDSSTFDQVEINFTPQDWFQELQSKHVMKWSTINYDSDDNEINYLDYNYKNYNSYGTFNYIVVKTSNNLDKDKGGVIFDNDKWDVLGYNHGPTEITIKKQSANINHSVKLHSWNNHYSQEIWKDIPIAKVSTSNAQKMKSTPFTIHFNNGRLLDFVYKIKMIDLYTTKGSGTYPDSPEYNLLYTKNNPNIDMSQTEDIEIGLNSNGINQAYNSYYLLKNIKVKNSGQLGEIIEINIAIKFDDDGNIYLRDNSISQSCDVPIGVFATKGSWGICSTFDAIYPNTTVSLLKLTPEEIYVPDEDGGYYEYEEHKYWSFSHTYFPQTQYYGTANWYFEDLTLDWNIKIEAANYSNYTTSLKGDILMIVPVSKSNNAYNILNSLKNLNPTIYWLNNTNGLTIGSSSILGSPINDIPLQILQAAIGRYKFEKETVDSISNSLSSNIKCNDSGDPDYLSVLDRNWPFCPIANHCLIVNNEETTSDGKEWHYWALPCLFSDMYYIPITIVSRNENNKISTDDTSDDILGGANFFKTFESLFEDKTLYRKNTILSDPAMYNPNFYQWKYITDGYHSLTLDAAQIDWNQFEKEKEWDINLNTVIGDSTYYKLDLGKLWNKYYPYTKNQMELVTQDSRLSPYSCENYYNWLQGNQTTYQTSKDAFNLTNMYAGINDIAAGISSVMGGAEEGFKTFGPVGAAVGGVISGVTSAIGSGLGFVKRKQFFDLEWNKQFRNMYRSPSYTNVNGFASGSLIFSLWDNNTSDNLSMFKTYTLPEIERKEFWNEIAWKGYNYNSMATYDSFNNRVNFNYFEMDTTTKSAVIDNYIRTHLVGKTLLFTQQEFLDWFKLKLNNGVRLFNKVWDLSYSSDSQLVIDNIEWDIYHWDQSETKERSLKNNSNKRKYYLKNKMKKENPSLYEKVYLNK